MAPGSTLRGGLDNVNRARPLSGPGIVTRGSAIIKARVCLCGRKRLGWFRRAGVVLVSIVMLGTALSVCPRQTFASSVRRVPVRSRGRRTTLSARKGAPDSRGVVKVPIEGAVSFGVAPGSDKTDAHPAHTKHDHCRNDPGDDCAADHESVGERFADAMGHNDHTRPSREMRKDRRIRRANSAARGGCSRGP
jgi:hypothetical protein